MAASSLYNFTPGSSGSDPTQQAGYNQYIQQGQNMISPGQATVQAANPISAAGAANLAQAFAQSKQQPQLPAQLPSGIAQQALAQGAQMNPNVSGQNMGGVGPTQQNLALAQGLMQSQMPQGNIQQFMNPPSDN